MKKIRNVIVAATAAAALMVPVMPAAPAAAAEPDCELHFFGLSSYVWETVDCVVYVLSTVTDLPPHV